MWPAHNTLGSARSCMPPPALLGQVQERHRLQTSKQVFYDYIEPRVRIIAVACVTRQQALFGLAYDANLCCTVPLQGHVLYSPCHVDKKTSIQQALHSTYIAYTHMCIGCIGLDADVSWPAGRLPKVCMDSKVGWIHGGTADAIHT